jgi:hypothetical protein
MDVSGQLHAPAALYFVLNYTDSLDFRFYAILYITVFGINNAVSTSMVTYRQITGYSCYMW